MKAINLLIITLLLIVNLPAKTPRVAGGDCIPAQSKRLLNINKIRTELLLAGDIWWGEDSFQTINPFTGEPDERLKVNGASIWVGGIDPGGSLKLAASTGDLGAETDFYPGPLNQFTGTTSKEDCIFWDKHFSVTKEEIEEHLRLFQMAENGEIEYTEEMIPVGVRGWPAKGNPYFRAMNGFDLPSTGQGLASYFEGGFWNGIYDPLSGDFPSTETIWRNGLLAIPDQMVFWIFNDAGGIHTNSTADAMQMEFQMTAYAYNSLDYLDYTTFYDAKIINRATEDIDDAYFGIWLDVGGNATQDIIMGCDTTRDLAYFYNQNDETSPIFSVDILRGPVGFSDTPQRDFETGEILIDSLTLDTIFTWEQSGLKSFTYYNNSVVGIWPRGTTEPNTAEEFYNCLTGRWKDGSRIESGGSGFRTGGTATNFAFPDSPDCTAPCWTMCKENLNPSDRKALLSTGNFKLKPGDVNSLTFSTNWIPDHPSDCLNLDLLYEVSDYNKNIFNFHAYQVIGAPQIEWEVENFSISGEIIYDEEIEDFPAYDFFAPDFLSEEEKFYHFEGYQIFQLKEAYDYSKFTDFDDTTIVRLVYQTDIANGIGKIYNWEASPNPDPQKPPIWRATEMVKAIDPDQGLERNFELTDDAFEDGEDKSIQPNRYYHYAVRAYSCNNWKTFDPFAGGGIGSGQKRSYFRSRLRTYTVGKIISFENTKVVPNPSFNDSELRIVDIPIGCKISLFDSSGRLIDFWESNEEEVFPIDTNIPETGVYFFKIERPDLGETVLKWISI